MTPAPKAVGALAVADAEESALDRATTLCERMSVESAESELTLVAAVGMSDPVRVEAPKSVETCRRAGVR